MSESVVPAGVLSSTSAPEVIIVDDAADEVSCDGGGPALGHPVVWYSFAGGTAVTCGYCDREFVKRQG